MSRLTNVFAPTFDRLKALSASGVLDSPTDDLTEIVEDIAHRIVRELHDLDARVQHLERVLTPPPATSFDAPDPRD